MNYQGKKCIVLGMGKSGLAAARLLFQKGAIVSVVDSGTSESLKEKRALLSSDKIKVYLGAEAENDPTIYDLAILSPGIPLTAPLVTNVTRKGTPVLGELELASSFTSRPLIAITGTNGKTTTTELTTRVLQGAGLRTIACGNIGLPFSEALLLSDQLDLFVIEVSSFQLEGVETFHPHVAVWLNLTPNHLDRYQSIEEYRAAKLRIFKNLKEEDSAVIPFSFDRISAGIKARCITFSTITQEADFSFSNNLLFYKQEPFLNIQETHLRGLHNVENLMAAFAVGIALKQPLESMSKAIKDYTPPAHRCEWVAENNGILWINDSKSTTLDALEKAILSIDKSRPIILIAGGKNKGSSFKPLLPLIQDRVKVAILIGELKKSIASEWNMIRSYQADTVEEAVSKAEEIARFGDAILFSPGTSSYDMFTNYEERGNCFKKAVQLTTNRESTN
ncbi:MAG: UDP-N-acetylmuramoyl-L-alanine--D-glutamate ligase, partial [Chthoniobacterales bacterium]|nr:UDP-N-acetylmuramoyl-L-alanine--D-glutamate ligase [Chthoniobacterales bacterium]